MKVTYGTQAPDLAMKMTVSEMPTLKCACQKVRRELRTS